MEEKETKIIRKEFSIYDFEKEEAFLAEESALGWHFKSLEKTDYTFEKDETVQPKEYLIDFYTEPLTEDTVQVYNDDGFYVEFVYNSGKDGIWYYFSREKGDNQPPKVHQTEGRIFLLTRVMNRIERFGLVIMALSLGFFTFTYIRYRELVFLLVAIMILVMAIYVYKIYHDIKVKIKEYQANT